MIKDATTDPKTKEVDKVSNALAHAVLGAAEALATGKNAFAGAAAGAGGEVAASYLTETLFPNKKPDELTESEKQQIVFLSQLAGGLAAGLVGDSSVEAASGVDIARRAVENNLLKYAMENPEQVSQLGLREEGNKRGKEMEEKAAKEAVEEAVDVADKYAPHYISVNADLYGIGVKTTINLRNADMLSGGYFSPATYPTRASASATVSLGWFTNLEGSEIKDPRGNRLTGNIVSENLKGNSVSASGCYKLVCAGYGATIPTNSSSKVYNTLELGVGKGGSVSNGNKGGSINLERMFEWGEK